MIKSEWKRLVMEGRKVQGLATSGIEVNPMEWSMELSMEGKMEEQ
ncbi:MAG: hypothetical protein AAGD05_11975 [Bacteroidota bacterium]